MMSFFDLGPLGLGSNRDWREGPPFMATKRIVLREVRRGDAPALYRLTRSPDIARHTWPPPSSVEAFEAFIDWAREGRANGRHAAFAVLPTGASELAGLFDLRSLQDGFVRAEFSFFLDRSLWGTGAFLDAARLVVDFALTVAGTQRIEIRCEADNDRANGALKKLGAVREGRLRAAFERDGVPVDQFMWAIVKDLDWR